MRLQDDLLRQLIRNGWAVTRQREGLEWWAHEIWTLQSQWAPHGLTLFLTFLADPQPGNISPFWAVGTSRTYPQSSVEAGGEPSLTVTPNWDRDLPRFAADLNVLRESAAEKRPVE